MISLWNHIVRPIKWKKILQGLTISYQMMSQYKSFESVLKMDQNFFPYCRFLKKRSVNDFIFASYMLLHPNTAQNCRKSHSYMIFHWELFQKHSVRFSGMEIDGGDSSRQRNQNILRAASVLATRFSPQIVPPCWRQMSRNV